MSDIEGEKIGIPDEIRQTFESVEKYDFVIGYFPTFRLQEAISPFISADLHEYLSEANAALLIRPHRRLSIEYPESEHVYQLPAYGDVYPFLDQLDVLITDYSSIGFDFSITGKPVLFYTFDRERYEKERGVHENFNQLTDGHRVSNMSDLVERLRSIQEDSKPTQNDLNRYFAHKDGRSSERLAEIVLNRGQSTPEGYLSQLENSP